MPHTFQLRTTDLRASLLLTAIDGDDSDGWLQQTRGDDYKGIIKEGEFNTSSGTYDWTISLKIPAAEAGERYRGGWFIWDTSRVVNPSPWTEIENIDGTPYPQFDSNGNLTGNLKALSVKITYNGVTYEIPYIDYADENDRFCYMVYGNAAENGVYYSTGLYLGMKCTCEEDRCAHWNSEAGKCVDWYFYDSSLPITAQQYGGLGYYYNNVAPLASFVLDEENGGELITQEEGGDGNRVKIPGILNKSLYLQEITAPDGYHLDTTRYWIVFCNNSSATCETCAGG